MRGKSHRNESRPPDTVHDNVEEARKVVAHAMDNRE